ncbi:hypothetical protein MBANPS3_008167 [Mucor bainieri]
MFYNTIVFVTEKKALALYVQLFNDSSKGRLIQHIYFKSGFDAFWVVKAIFDTAPMPNLQTLNGAVKAPDFYSWLLGFAKDSTSSAFPKYNNAVEQVYCDTLLRFRDSISTIDMNRKWEYFNDTIRNFIQQLDAFDRLTTFTFSSRFHQLSEIELLLKGCNHLETLSLKCFVNDHSMDKAALDAWMV